MENRKRKIEKYNKLIKKLNEKNEKLDKKYNPNKELDLEEDYWEFKNNHFKLLRKRIDNLHKELFSEYLENIKEIRELFLEKIDSEIQKKEITQKDLLSSFMLSTFNEIIDGYTIEKLDAEASESFKSTYNIEFETVINMINEKIEEIKLENKEFNDFITKKMSVSKGTVKYVDDKNEQKVALDELINKIDNRIVELEAEENSHNDTKQNGNE